MGMGHVPQEPIRPEGSNFQFQGRQRRRTPAGRSRRPRQALVGQQNQQVGAWGEDLVARWYGQHEYEIVERNWRCRQGEIDIIARRDQVLVVCEVKTRSSADYGSPASAVGLAKQQRLRRLIGHWLRENSASGLAIRFDVAAVVGTRQSATIEVIEGAF